MVVELIWSKYPVRINFIIIVKQTFFLYITFNNSNLLFIHKSSNVVVRSVHTLPFAGFALWDYTVYVVVACS